MRVLAQQPRVGAVVGHMCCHGLTTPGPDGVEEPALKPTRWMSSSPALLNRLSRRCNGQHKHGHLVGRPRTQKAACYTDQLCREILDGIEEEKQREVKALARLLVVERCQRFLGSVGTTATTTDRGSVETTATTARDMGTKSSKTRRPRTV